MRRAILYYSATPSRWRFPGRKGYTTTDEREDRALDTPGDANGDRRDYVRGTRRPGGNATCASCAPPRSAAAAEQFGCRSGGDRAGDGARARRAAGAARVDRPSARVVARHSRAAEQDQGAGRLLVDALSSAAYATEEILLLLVFAGAPPDEYVVPIGSPSWRCWPSWSSPTARPSRRIPRAAVRISSPRTTWGARRACWPPRRCCRAMC